MWPAIHTRPDLAYLMGILSQFYKNLGPAYVKLVKRVLQYIYRTLDLGFTFDRKADTPDNVIGYTDSNFARSKTDWKSIGGWVFLLTRAAISHSSKLLLIIALSICKAEYIAMCGVRRETIWLGYLLAELGFWKKSTLVILYADNQDLIILSNNPKSHWQTKHIEV